MANSRIQKSIKEAERPKTSVIDPILIDPIIHEDHGVIQEPAVFVSDEFRQTFNVTQRDS